MEHSPIWAISITRNTLWKDVLKESDHQEYLVCLEEKDAAPQKDTTTTLVLTFINVLECEYFPTSLSLINIK